ncbi:hypothetical protein T484DRAFT_1748148 [Baffinella frigidus]|nr:hypothetical protein T484DRAFT_1748148 [Cryptophyta sp. CCMP2293]
MQYARILNGRQHYIITPAVEDKVDAPWSSCNNSTSLGKRPRASEATSSSIGDQRGGPKPRIEKQDKGSSPAKTPQGLCTYCNNPKDPTESWRTHVQNCTSQKGAKASGNPVYARCATCRKPSYNCSCRT